MPTDTLVRVPKRGPYKHAHPSEPSDISTNRHQRVRDLHAAHWSYTQISAATGYTRRHVIRICHAQ